MSTNIVVVCTGNVCRSPLAERLLARALAERGVAASVSSAGLVTDGMPASAEVVDLLLERGLDATEHRSRLLRPAIVDDAHLVLGMARRHVGEVVLCVPDAFERTFTLKELVRRGRAVGPREEGERLASWLVRVGAGRRRRQLLGDCAEDDIVDPIGEPMEVYRRVAAEIDALTIALVDLVWPVPG